MKKQKKHLVNFLKVMGILLIINSHSDALFPGKIKALATGGALGNSIFFIISGYFTSEKIYRWKDILLRFVRLYFPVYIMLFFYVFTNNNHLSRIDGIKTWIEVFIWPTPYWFVSASFVCFLILNICKKWINDRSFFIISVICLFVFFVCYILGIDEKGIWIVEDGKMFGLNIHFKCIYCFYLYCVGYYIKVSQKLIQGYKSIIITILSFALTYLVKILMQKGIIPMYLQIVSQVFVVGFAVGALQMALVFEEFYKRSNRYVIGFFDELSKLSLEAYVIQIMVIPIAAKWITAAFPVNYILTTLVILAMAFCMSLLDRKIEGAIKEALNITTEKNRNNDKK